LIDLDRLEPDVQLAARRTHGDHLVGRDRGLRGLSSGLPPEAGHGESLTRDQCVGVALANDQIDATDGEVQGGIVGVARVGLVVVLVAARSLGVVATFVVDDVDLDGHMRDASR